MFERKKIKMPWEGQIPPFKIIGNAYFAGTYQASSHLIDTGEGLILIDTGYANSLYLLIDSIYSLGFNPRHVKYILHSHWHGDHTEATKALVELSGAKTFIGAKDAEKVKKYFTPDVLINDGDIITLGNTSIRCIDTPGHTEGCISFFFDAKSGNEKYKVGMFGGAGANTLQKGCFDYPDCREDYIKSLDRLRGEMVDVFIGNHVWNNNTEFGGEILRNTGENRFINDKIWYEFLDFCEKRLKKIIEEEKINETI